MSPWPQPVPVGPGAPSGARLGLGLGPPRPRALVQRPERGPPARPCHGHCGAAAGAPAGYSQQLLRTGLPPAPAARGPRVHPGHLPWGRPAQPEAAAPRPQASHSLALRRHPTLLRPTRGSLALPLPITPWYCPRPPPGYRGHPLRGSPTGPGRKPGAGAPRVPAPTWRPPVHPRSRPHQLSVKDIRNS